jgi:thiosulfate/3-mercaptopyruvate sulfurtransferase
MPLYRTLSASLALALIVQTIAAAQEGSKHAPGAFAGLMSFDQLQHKLGDSGLRILDARERDEYARAHLPRAVWVDVKLAQRLSASEAGLSDDAAWRRWVEPLGVDPATEIVVYDGQRQLNAARVWWLLTYLGATNVSLLDGGFALWSKQGRPVATAVPQVASRSFSVKLQAARRATRSQVLDSLKSGRHVVIDARSAAEFSGAELRSKRGGHVPGACHLEWLTLVDADGRFFDAASLRAKLKAIRIEPGQSVITHCQSGGRASVNAFVLERLGFPARNYYLGWSDWGNSDETPVDGNGRR